MAKEMLTTMEEQSSSVQPPAKKRRRASLPKVKSKPEQPAPEGEPSSAASDTEDSSSDSSSDSTSDAEEGEETVERPPLTDEWAALIMAGATATVASVTTAAMQLHPASSLAPRFSALARRETRDPPEPGLASAAAAFVLDMPPLEDQLPPPFPEHAKSSSKRRKKQQD